jgi:hypothetical protein
MLIAFHNPYGVPSQFTADGSPNRMVSPTFASFALGGELLAAPLRVYRPAVAEALSACQPKALLQVLQVLVVDGG